MPRRNDITQMSSAEMAILEAKRLIEKMGADPQLTAAIVLLGQAGEKVADFIDRGVLRDQRMIDALRINGANVVAIDPINEVIDRV